MGRLVIYGAGGFGREVVTAARNCGSEILFLSDGPAVSVPGVTIISAADLRDDDEIVIAVADPQTRKRLAEGVRLAGTVIAPTAIVGARVRLGGGAIICDFAITTSDVWIGSHFHCNTHSTIGHDCVVGDFVTFGPHVSCNGNVHIGDGARIGAGATIMNGTPRKPLRIGAGAVVGIGSVVMRNVPAGCTVFGNPATIVKRPAADPAASAQE